MILLILKPTRKKCGDKFWCFESFLDDVNVVTDDVPGWEIASSGVITVALDTSISEELREEGVSRDFVNKDSEQPKRAWFRSN